MNTLAIEPKLIDKSDGNIYLVPQLAVDGVQLADFNTFAVDMVELQRSLTASGEFFILTCWCGDPGCAGIEEGIQVSHEGSIVHWRLQEPFNESRFVFSQSELMLAFNSSLEAIRRTWDHQKASSSKTIKVVPRGSKEIL